MTLQTDRAPEVEISRERTVRQKHHILWPLALLLAIVIAAVVGVAVVAYLNRPAATTATAYQEPNANTREGRMSATTVQEPNANVREGRVPTTTIQQPNANTREGRVSDS